ncbi:MAG: hypothetical protein QOD07_2791 [Frankiaceae bacterium]|jgi:hypothetical protein|nr:hypothetical protein [Frankiaceae bacterium]
MSGRHRQVRQPRHRQLRRRHLTRATAVVVAGVLCGLAVPDVAVRAASSAPAPAFTRSEKISRTHLGADGKDVVADARTFRVSVDTTSGLRDRQEVDVAWSGAHPTGGVYPDSNAPLAAQQEYPVVVMECRGIDSTKAPATQRLSPETCFTQTPSERVQARQDFIFPAFRLDRYATASDRQIDVGIPANAPSDCDRYLGGAQHWTPFLAVDGHRYDVGPQGCAGMPPESVNTVGTFQEANTTYAASDLNGNGSTKFTITTADVNASLGCSEAVACSLVVIPIEGISCDPAATSLPSDDQPVAQGVGPKATTLCETTGSYAAGQQSNGFFDPGQSDLAVRGELWWSASNWRNRISVPLHFAHTSDVCALVNNGAPTYVYGSEIMTEATAQWAPAFCLNRKLFKFQHVQTGEPEAKALLQSGAVKAAFAAAPPTTPFTRPVVQAPVAVSGFAIAYAIDDAKHRAFHNLKLTPRLIAKLMTESYPATPDVQKLDTPLAHNPLNIAADPEFLALNPGVPADGIVNEAAATLLSLSSNSDVIESLTSYLAADPDAHAFLAGTPDPWGMVVNPAYKNVTLPTNSWPLLDQWPCPCNDPNTLPGFYNATHNPCLFASPSPWLNLVAAPVASLATITLDLQFSIANSQITCANAGAPNQKETAYGRETPGERFLLGIVPLADAVRYRLDTAQLLTHVDPAAATKFTNADGRIFVGPSEASLTSTATLLRPNPTLGTWPVPYSTMRTSAAGAGAYPGTLLLSADVPTSGLSTTDATRYAELLRFAAGPGQTAGTGNGDLPAGFVPMTAATGLDSLAAYTLRAADAVQAQSGAVPSVLGVTPTKPVSAPPPAVGTGGTAPPPAGSTPPDLPRGTVVPPSVAPPVVAEPARPVAAELPAIAPTGAWLVPLTLTVLIGSAIVAVGAWLLGRRRA